ncbi:hypothetical protein LTR36_001915 [Oleoguttula mirabilis]|uniref:WAC domain-containing protein n=1 Tax=Oleoguttula mirabilis TaxID=1507867 RepID=A0AAV9JN07_9PEZI|nr:hypothetical protein LTR36_001915 [Oleoguttula mirabilis]
MVLFKRKPITMVPPQTSIPDNQEVFVMKGTDEVFTEYEKYLKRLDYLMQKKFVDAVNGKSGLTFFDALESETKSSSAIENVFPDVLKDPILRKVQFSQISRIDDLVSSVFDEFKKDFFPGEDVLVIFDDGEQMEGVIREKAKFPMIRGPDGTIQRAAFSRYFVRCHNQPGEEALVDDKHIRRDKKVFTKQNLRSFLKHSLQREAWIGAPWLVKEHLAIQYRLPMEIPGHLLQDAKLLANKVYTMPAPTHYRLASLLNVTNAPQQQMLQMKPPKGRRSNKSEDIMRQQQELARMQQLQQQVSHCKLAARAQTLMSSQHPGAQPQQLQQMQNYQQPLATRMEPKPLPPPVIKYPIEDLDLPPKRDGHARPQLNFFTEEMRQYILSNRRIFLAGLSMESMGLLLEVWNTLNVQCEVYVLDSFTFDDFVDAIQYKDVDSTCELLEEMHCAVLKQLVDKNGKILAKHGLKEVVAEVPDDASELHDESELSTPQPDVPARSTRSRLSHVDLAYDNPRTPTLDKSHRAAEMLGDRSWKTRLVAREFEDGGWQVILIGLLNQLSANPKYKARCDRILSELAPMAIDPSKETARLQYAELDANLRVSALQIITILSVSTPAIKEFLDQCSDDMTDVRKRKIEHQREKKACMELLQQKDRDRKILYVDNMPVSPTLGSAEPVSVNGEGDDTLETNGAGSSDPDDEAPSTGRSLRRGNDRKRKRDEDAARREKERAEKAEAAKTQNKQSKEWKKLLHDIEELKKQVLDHESKIQECDADLREANVQRTKVLGKDRYCNRYYWFERNGQPFGGLPRSSTASYGYANARIWVQGPDEMESEGFIDRTPEEQKEYRARFNMTVPERRKAEEGETRLQDAHEWGFYDDPERLDNLIGWLDDHGEREKKLRKELCEWRDTIVQYMDAYKKFLADEEVKKVEAEQESDARVSTRHKLHEEQTATKDRCTKWTNTMAFDEIGHIHSRPEKKPAPKKQAKQAKGVAMVSRSTGKPVTRQGGSYSFK